MNMDELTETLLRAERPEWPGIFALVEPQNADIPGPIAARIRREISVAVAAGPIGQPERTRRRRILQGSIAAGFLVAMSVAGAIAYRHSLGQSERMTAAAVLGPAFRISGASRTSFGSKDTIAPGETLHAPSGSEVFLRLRGTTVLAVRGPARVRFGFRNDHGRNVLTGDVELGAIAIRSEGSSHMPVEWRDGENRFVMEGTVAELDVNVRGATLRVLSGRFRALRGISSEGYPVIEGQTMTLLKSGRTVIERMTAADRKHMENLSERMAAVAAGRMILSEARKFGSDDEIRQHYGTLHRVRLADGRDFVGYAVRGGETVRVHTVFGLLRIPETDVLKITEDQ